MVNPGIERVRVNGFAFPLGVYPVEPIAPKAGFTVDFEPADGDEEWEEWPDRYRYEVLVSAERIKPLCSALFSLLPGRFYPILDVLGNDAFREIDPYIAYELVGCEGFYDGLRWFEPFLYEDGLCGFGAMSEEPFMYFFIDEHKVLTIRVETHEKERVDRLLTAFDLTPIAGEIQAPDAVGHEHRSVLLTPDEQPELPGPEEVTEALVDLWGMTLNIDVERNTDDEGADLGVTAWRCVVRRTQDDDVPADASKPATRYAEVLLTAPNWRAAEEMALHAAVPEAAAQGKVAAVDPLDDPDLRLVAADRVTRRELDGLLGAPTADEAFEPGSEGRILRVRWLE